MTATKGNVIKASDILTATEIANTYPTKANAIKGISASGSTLTLTKGDGTTSTVTVSGGGTSLSSNVTSAAPVSVTVASIQDYNYTSGYASISFYASSSTVLSAGNALTSAISPKPQATSAPSQGNRRGQVQATDKLSLAAGISAGTYTLQNLLNKLAEYSHTHPATRTITISNCECNCDCNDSG